MGGVIAAGGHETVRAGAAMLQRGGNAVDAAVAAAFASFVSEVGLVHLGGSGMAQIFSPQTGSGIVYDFFSDMPGVGQREKVAMDFEPVTIDFGGATQDFYLGRASVAVSGNIIGLCQLAATHGRLPLSTLLEPAIQFARQGVPIGNFQAKTCELLAPLYTHTAGMREIFAKNGQLIRPSERLFIPYLADTLSTLAKEGESYVRRGTLAQAILADQRANGGLLTATDLLRYQVRQCEPIRIAYRGYEVLLPPPSSVGGILIAFSLKLLAHFKVRELAHGSSSHLRLLYEVMQATTLARRDWDTISQEMSTEEAMAEFLAEKTEQKSYKKMLKGLNDKPSLMTASEPKGPSNTSHISVMDSSGMTVSLTTTAGESAGYVVPETGYIPNNMLGEADLHPHGFHTRAAGERIPTMMSPTIVLKDGKPCLVVGSGGSTRLRTAILQVLCNLLDYDMTLYDGVEASRVHLEKGALQCEGGYNSIALDELEQIGYPVNRWQKRSLYFGGVHSVARTKEGQLIAMADQRREGVTAVVQGSRE